MRENAEELLNIIESGITKFKPMMAVKKMTQSYVDINQLDRNKTKIEHSKT